MKENIVGINRDQLFQFPLYPLVCLRANGRVLSEKQRISDDGPSGPKREMNAGTKAVLA
ncbi:hypothetical protein [Paenibacillus rhizovicinus]|uniref:hypothetical protein n=1 Tax=Paenibacillus rhizovicinus TaxID=2704463 RepID=UPI00298CAC0A|nr:hypothetical protein [Paenibacillus rhizovicinus]